jgi:hypothetical protein
MQHFAIKIVNDDTDEYRILRYLNQMSHEILRENCILPVIEFLPTPGFWFVVMPRSYFSSENHLIYADKIVDGEQT